MYCVFITGHLLRLCLPHATKATGLNLAVQPTLSSQPSISSSQHLEMSFEERSHELRAPLVTSPLEEPKSLLMKVKEESEKAGLLKKKKKKNNSTFKKLRSRHPVPSLHGK